MSGFVGVIHLDGRPVAMAELVAMADRQPFRAPQGPAFWCQGPAGFGALPSDRSDPTDSSAVAEGKGLVVVGDVRLDNRGDLLAELQLPKETSDIEVTVAAYREWGVDSPARLLGDFAFAVWDASHDQLMLARDAMGMRPLYYAATPGRMVIASEIDQLLVVGPSPQLNRDALASFLIGVMPPEGDTYYRAIRELPPGRSLVASPDGHAVKEHWRPDPATEIRHSDEWEYAEQLRGILRESVRCRLRSEAPVGILLSGGLDSGAAASTAALLIRDGAATAPELRPYSWASPSLPEIDERHISQLLVDEFGLDATDVPVEGAWPLEPVEDLEPCLRRRLSDHWAQGTTEIGLRGQVDRVATFPDLQSECLQFGAESISVARQQRSGESALTLQPYLLSRAPSPLYGSAQLVAPQPEPDDDLLGEPVDRWDPT